MTRSFSFQRQSARSIVFSDQTLPPPGSLPDGATPRVRIPLITPLLIPVHIQGLFVTSLLPWTLCRPSLGVSAEPPEPSLAADCSVEWPHCPHLPLTLLTALVPSRLHPWYLLPASLHVSALFPPLASSPQKGQVLQESPTRPSSIACVLHGTQDLPRLFGSQYFFHHRERQFAG